jgi:hypothetical protein
MHRPKPTGAALAHAVSRAGSRYMRFRGEHRERLAEVDADRAVCHRLLPREHLASVRGCRSQSASVSSPPRSLPCLSTERATRARTDPGRERNGWSPMKRLPSGPVPAHDSVEPRQPRS